MFLADDVVIKVLFAHKMCSQSFPGLSGMVIGYTLQEVDQFT